jgi:hypothetical protein
MKYLRVIVVKDLKCQKLYYRKSFLMMIIKFNWNYRLKKTM